jgi:immune inhibitor A
MDSVSFGTEILAKPLYNIKMTDDGYVTFDFLKRFPTGIHDVIVDKSVDARIYSIDGRYVGCDASKLRTGVYIRNHRKFVVK